MCVCVTLSLCVSVCVNFFICIIYILYIQFIYTFFITIFLYLLYMRTYLMLMLLYYIYRFFILKIKVCVCVCVCQCMCSCSCVCVCVCVCMCVCVSLQLIQRPWGSQTPNPECREELLLGEGGMEGVDVCQCVWGPSSTWGHSVKGESASRPVHIHSYSVIASGAERYVCFYIVLPDSVTIIKTIETPGLVVPSKPAVITLSFPCDSSVCHSYINTSFPLYLPVTAASQILSSQHLEPGVKSLWVIRILFNLCCLSVVLRQRESCVGCVWVQCEFTGIWGENKTLLPSFSVERSFIDIVCKYA